MNHLIDEVGLLVRNYTLAELDKLWGHSVKMVDKSVDEPLALDYWQDIELSLREARELAEYCFMENIPTVQIHPIATVDYRMEDTIKTMIELEKRIKGINKYLSTLSGKIEQLEQSKLYNKKYKY